MATRKAPSRGPLWSLARCFVDVLFFWQVRLWQWWTHPTDKQLLLEALSQAQIFEEWEAAAYALDDIEENTLWRQNHFSKHYDYKLINDRLQSVVGYMEDGDIFSLVNLLRSGLVRNLGNITAPRLYSRAYAGTKLLIEDYITQCALAIEHVASFPTKFTEEAGFTAQAKLDLLHDTRQAFGRTVLVLQGGSIFGLCHIGVVKALHLRGVLPRIIAGTATGALIAAVVGVHSEGELLKFLSGGGIDLSAFDARRQAAGQGGASQGWIGTLLRRTRRFLSDGYLLDANALEECVKANVGELTFAEAYQKTKRVLNITISTPTSGAPNLLNYLTAPHVLVWSAALASNAPDSATASAQLFCKDDAGRTMTWSEFHDSELQVQSKTRYGYEQENPLSRIAELFNVNHFIVSQARPYIAPFLQSDLSSPKPGYAGPRKLSTTFLKVVYMEIQHRLHQLDSLGYLSHTNRRFLLDDNVPGASLTLVPEVTLWDFSKLLENPSKEMLDYWILKGERSVWPAINALKIRCAVEVELDRGYQVVRRRKPFDATTPAPPPATTAAGGENGEDSGEGPVEAPAAGLGEEQRGESKPTRRKRRKVRAQSVGGTSEQ